MPLYTETITGDSAVLAGASVGIYLNDVLADLFSDAAHAVPLANPLTTDVNGNISCYMDNGNYRLDVSADGYRDRSIDIGFYPVLQTQVAEREVIDDFVIAADDCIIWVNADHDVIGTFPAIADWAAGNKIIIKNKTNNKVDRSMDALLNDADPADTPLTMQGESMTVTSDGTGWQSYL